MLEKKERLDKEVKKIVKNKNFYFTILDVIRDNLGTKEILLRLNISKQGLNYYIKPLRETGVIKKIGRGIWEISQEFRDSSNEEILGFIDSKKDSKKKSSIGLKKANLHALNINIPISEGAINLKELGGYESKLNNWVAQYKRIRSLGLTLRNNNNRSISVFLWSREIFDYLAIPPICQMAVHTVCSYFKEKGVVLDYFGWRVTTLHLMIRNKDFDQILNKGIKIEVALGREAKKISERDITREARAWIDKTPYSGIETDDLQYYENYILMPENISKMAVSMNQLNNELIPNIQNLNNSILMEIKNKNLHMNVLNDMKKTLRSIRGSLSQKSLLKWT